uniref:Uncharacterized protein n=1 Tax=Salix viminalis TaxID=40686 RepID=A0A6N2N148_SALVM
MGFNGIANFYGFCLAQPAYNVKGIYRELETSLDTAVFRGQDTEIIVVDSKGKEDERGYNISKKRREKNPSNGDVTKWKSDRVYIDKHGKWRIFDHKKMSRKRCGSLRGQGWKYGSGFVDGVFPVLSPVAHQILNFS